jgi:hypothetical protein
MPTFQYRFSRKYKGFSKFIKENFVLHVFDLRSISASYNIKCHIMTNDAYGIELWQNLIWSILVSKRSSGPQQSHTIIKFGLQLCLKIKKSKKKFTFINFSKPLYFWPKQCCQFFWCFWFPRPYTRVENSSQTCNSNLTIFGPPIAMYECWDI